MLQVFVESASGGFREDDALAAVREQGDDALAAVCEHLV
jgi:hypothetical protein